MALLAFELPVLGAEGVAGTGPGAEAAGAGARDSTLAAIAAPPKKSKKASSSSSKAKDTDAAALPPMPPHISSLLDPSQRLRTARELNAAILHAQGHPAESKLPQLLGVMAWGEGLLNEKGLEWPKCECRRSLCCAWIRV